MNILKTVLSSLLLAGPLWPAPLTAAARQEDGGVHRLPPAGTEGDTLRADSTRSMAAALTRLDAAAAAPADSSRKRAKRDWTTWRPTPKRALWLGLVLPGAGQIYNRKYWKLPIIYGGFVGCAYAMRWNNMMYRDYSQAYLDIMDSDPMTQSYNQFLHLGNQITPENMLAGNLPQTQGPLPSVARPELLRDAGCLRLVGDRCLCGRLAFRV